MILDACPHRDVVDIHIRLPRSSRAEVHFHLDASEGLAYLEQGDAPDLGIVHASPDFVDELLRWLERMENTLHVSILRVEDRNPPST